MKTGSLIWFGVIALIGVQLATGRTFTDVEGRKIEASIVEVHTDKVELKLKKNKKSYKVPLDKLSPADIEYINEWKETREKELASAAEEADGKKKAAPASGAAALKKQYSLKDNFDAEWPDRINSGFDVKIETFKSDPEKKTFIYHSPNYEFICDVALSKNVVKKFAALFEATREYCRELPISTIKAHVPGEQFRHRILLFETKRAYVQNGGPPSSAGVFMSRGGNGIVMAPLESLGVKKVGSSYMFDYKGSNKTLPHELTHQLTDWEYFSPGARGWFSEGLAEYVATTPYRSGKFMVKTNLSAIKAYATANGKDGSGGRRLGEKVTAPRLKKYMLQSYSSFTARGNFNYGMGLLITYYFFHWDGEGDRANINAFLKALKEGKQGEESLKVLLNGRSWEELEKSISKAWRSRGIRIKFGASY